MYRIALFITLLFSSLNAATEVAVFSDFPLYDPDWNAQLPRDISFTSYVLPEKADKTILPMYGIGDKIIFFNLDRPPAKHYIFNGIARKDLALFMWEPPTVLPKMYKAEYQAPFGSIFTWDDDLVDNQRFFKFYYPAKAPMINELIPFEEKKLCTLIATNHTSKYPHELYSERRRVIAFFERKAKDEFDLYGKYWEPELKTYGGPIGDKIDVLKHYRFSICFENTGDRNGYITEKIFDCFCAGVVPVYLGAPNITKYIPESCFIDMRKFSSYQKLYTFLKNMPEAVYDQYLEEIRAFLSSEMADRFTINSLIDSIEKFSSDSL